MFYLLRCGVLGVEIMAKKWFNSKMLWTNIGVLVASVGVYMETGDPAAVITALMAVINFMLRLVTKGPLKL